MNFKLKMGIGTALLALGLVGVSCGPATHVSVGVGVMYPGPWGGPIPPGSVVVGRPYPGPYYPFLPGSEDIDLAWEQKLEASLALDDSLQGEGETEALMVSSDSLESLR